MLFDLPTHLATRSLLSLTLGFDDIYSSFLPLCIFFFFSSFVGSSSSRNTWSLSSLKASCSLFSLDPCAFPSFLEYCFHPSPSLLSSTHVSSLNSKIYQFRDTSLDSANQLISPFCLLLISFLSAAYLAFEVSNMAQTIESCLLSLIVVASTF
jgi:hypothetical protein